MDWTTVLGFNTSEWSTSRVCWPICQTGDSTETPNIMKVMEGAGNSRCPHSHCAPTRYAAENGKPHHTWKINYLLELAMGSPTGMNEFLCTPGWGRTTLSLPISPSLSHYVLPPKANNCGMPKQVKLLNQSTSVSSRPGEHLLSPLVHSSGCHLCALHLSGGHYSTYRTTLTKFIQQALNDSQ